LQPPGPAASHFQLLERQQQFDFLSGPCTDYNSNSESSVRHCTTDTRLVFLFPLQLQLKNFYFSVLRWGSIACTLSLRLALAVLL
jgi:hypothetical protein